MKTMKDEFYQCNDDPRDRLQILVGDGLIFEVRCRNTNTTRDLTLIKKVKVTIEIEDTPVPVRGNRKAPIPDAMALNHDSGHRTAAQRAAAEMIEFDMTGRDELEDDRSVVLDMTQYDGPGRTWFPGKRWADKRAAAKHAGPLGEIAFTSNIYLPPAPHPTEDAFDAPTTVPPPMGPDRAVMRTLVIESVRSFGPRTFTFKDLLDHVHANWRQWSTWMRAHSYDLTRDVLVEMTLDGRVKPIPNNRTGVDTFLNVLPPGGVLAACDDDGVDRKPCA